MVGCPQCNSTSLVNIAMTLNGGPVKFFHCRSCEHRWWLDATHGASIALPEVLDKVATAV
jgi:transposase-like protein